MRVTKYKVNRKQSMIIDIEKKGTLSWCEAKAFIKSLGYAGYRDWRLPTRDELATLTGVDGLNDIKHPFKNVSESFYWSDSSVFGNPKDNIYWIAILQTGEVSTLAAELGKGLVCPVRGSMSVSDGNRAKGAVRGKRFQVNKDGTVTDLASGLQWVRDIGGEGFFKHVGPPIVIKPVPGMTISWDF